MSASTSTESGMSLNKLAAPILVIMVLSMMIIPLPPFLLDLFFTLNIALGLMVLLVSLYTRKVLDFSIFPAILLITALLRLSLNIASTRLVLMDGHSSTAAAGHVIEAFGNFMIGGSYVVGVVVFIILVVINFVVITKGAGRIAEVSARFTLDAMPGKQMAIDADLNAGMIGEEEARKRRSEIQQEAEFFGSMDGASKFVRGDAVAGIIIMLINVIGGLIVGVLQHDMSVGEATQRYVVLTIGDGLVAQIPSLLISTAAGIIVTRVSTEDDINEQLLNQLLFNRVQILYISGTIILMLGLVPNMPLFPFFFMSSVLFASAYFIDQRNKKIELGLIQPSGPAVPDLKASEAPEVTWDDVLPVDILGLEVGYRLIPLVDKTQDGDLLKRIRGIRKKIAQDLGFLVPSIHIRDNLQMRPASYRIMMKGVEIAQGEANSGMFLAINPGRVLGQVTGINTFDPTFGLPAVWIEPHQKDLAQTYGYTVVDPSTVIATHLSHVIQQHASELLGRDQVQQLVDHVAKTHPKLVEDLIPKALPLGLLQKVLQYLLEESVHIRDMRSIIEALADIAPRGIQDPEELTAHVRVLLGRAIIHEVYPGMNELQVIALEPQLEQILMQAVQSKTSDGGVGLEPGLAETILRQSRGAVQQQEQMGLPPVILVPPAIRFLMAKFLRRSNPNIRVISHAEVPDSKTVKVTAVIGSND